RRSAASPRARHPVRLRTFACRRVAALAPRTSACRRPGRVVPHRRSLPTRAPGRCRRRPLATRCRATTSGTGRWRRAARRREPGTSASRVLLQLVVAAELLAQRGEFIEALMSLVISGRLEAEHVFDGNAPMGTGFRKWHLPLLEKFHHVLARDIEQVRGLLRRQLFSDREDRN